MCASGILFLCCESDNEVEIVLVADVGTQESVLIVGGYCHSCVGVVDDSFGVEMTVGFAVQAAVAAAAESCVAVAGSFDADLVVVDSCVEELAVGDDCFSEEAAVDDYFVVVVAVEIFVLPACEAVAAMVLPDCLVAVAHVETVGFFHEHVFVVAAG